MLYQKFYKYNASESKFALGDTYLKTWMTIPQMGLKDRTERPPVKKKSALPTYILCNPLGLSFLVCCTHILVTKE